MSGSEVSRSDLSRRQVLQRAGAGAAALTLPGWLAACGGSDDGGSSTAKSGDEWKQFSGTTLNFISENTAPTSALAADLGPFKAKTGIDVHITQLELTALVQKLALDFSSGKASYEVIYADPYQVLAPYSEGLADLNEFVSDKSLPPVEKGIEDFIPTQLAAAGRFADKDHLYALPYDAPTMLWMYRKDLFEKYQKQMQGDLGFDPMPSDDSTWDQYYQIAKWFNDNVDEVKYGTGHQAKQHDSLMCDFSNVLWAFGGDYFNNGTEVGLIGSTDPGSPLLDSPEAIEAATFYQKLLKIAHPSSTGWDWTGVDEAFRAGEIAMVPNWHEFAAGIEKSKLGGKVDYARLPRGPKRAACMYGGTGIGIAKAADEKKRKAAWLFINYATSPEGQLVELKSKAGGGTPTRSSVYEMPQVKAAEKRPSPMPNILTRKAVFEAWQPENIGLRPKIKAWNECDTAIYTELSNMIAGRQSPKQTMARAKQGFEKAIARA